MRKSLIAALAGVLTLGVSGVAQAAFTQNADVSFTNPKAKSSTGIRANLNSSDPDAPNQKPKAVSNVVLDFPKGTKFNTSIPPLCKASTQQIQNTDGNVCRRAQIGRGTAAANVAPVLQNVNLSIKAYNVKGGLYFYLVPGGSLGNPFVLKGTLRGNRLTVPVPQLQPVPGVTAVLTSFVLNTRRYAKSGKYWLTTPKSCSGKWTSTTNFTYADGSTESVTSEQACRK